MVDYPTAEARCSELSGYLVSYENLEEQIEVEAAFLNTGALDMTYYNKYWIGLRVPNTRTWPNFVWDVPPQTNWSHWGEQRARAGAVGAGGAGAGCGAAASGARLLLRSALCAQDWHRALLLACTCAS